MASSREPLHASNCFGLFFVFMIGRVRSFRSQYMSGTRLFCSIGNLEPTPLAVRSQIDGPLALPRRLSPRQTTQPPQQIQAIYNYHVLREALNVMSQVPDLDQRGKQPPLLLMRTVIVSVMAFPELKNFVATVVLVRLVQQQVWLSCFLRPPISSVFFYARLRRLVVSVCYIGAGAKIHKPLRKNALKQLAVACD